MGREINSTTLNIECIASLLGNSMIGDYKFSLSCVQSLLYSLTCTEQEKKLVELPFYASASTDKYSDNSKNSTVIKTLVIENYFNNIKRQLKKQKHIQEFMELKETILSDCSALRAALKNV